MKWRITYTYETRAPQKVWLTEKFHSTLGRTGDERQQQQSPPHRPLSLTRRKIEHEKWNIIAPHIEEFATDWAPGMESMLHPSPLFFRLFCDESKNKGENPLPSFNRTRHITWVGVTQESKFVFRKKGNTLAQKLVRGGSEKGPTGEHIQSVWKKGRGVKVASFQRK